MQELYNMVKETMKKVHLKDLCDYLKSENVSSLDIDWENLGYEAYMEAADLLEVGNKSDAFIWHQASCLLSRRAVDNEQSFLFRTRILRDSVEHTIFLLHNGLEKTEHVLMQAATIFSKEMVEAVPSVIEALEGDDFPSTLKRLLSYFDNNNSSEIGRIKTMLERFVAA